MGMRRHLLILYCLNCLYRLWQTADYSESDPNLRNTLVQLLINPSEGYQSLLSSTAIALGKWLNHHSEESIQLRDELITAYKNMIIVSHNNCTCNPHVHVHVH